MEWKIMLKDCKTEPALALIPANNMTHSKIVVVLLLLYKDDTKCKQESFLKHAQKEIGENIVHAKKQRNKGVRSSFSDTLTRIFPVLHKYS